MTHKLILLKKQLPSNLKIELKFWIFREVKIILEQIPKLKPGIERGKPVRMSMSIPIDFRMKEGE